MSKEGISLFVELMPSLEGDCVQRTEGSETNSLPKQPEVDFYDVKTGMVTRNTYYKNKKPLWEKPQNG